MKGKEPLYVMPPQHKKNLKNMIIYKDVEEAFDKI